MLIANYAKIDARLQVRADIRHRDRAQGSLDKSAIIQASTFDRQHLGTLQKLGEKRLQSSFCQACIVRTGLSIKETLRRTCHNVVNVVAPLPPTDRQAAHEIGYEDTNNCVDVKRMGDSHMPGVVSCKDQLVPERAHTNATQGIPPQTQAHDHTGK